jgi:uncharacterized protein GlcG (DUF336 family)
MLGSLVGKTSRGEDDMRMKPAMTLDDAKKLMAAAEAEAVRNKWEVVIAILNDGGRIVMVHRMDGARPGNDEIAIAKATTSAMTCRPTVVWEKWIEGPHKAYATFPFIAAQGGLPIIVDGDLIGAIGVSGVKSFQDEQIAMTAIKAVFPDAKTVRAGEENDARDF